MTLISNLYFLCRYQKTSRGFGVGKAHELCVIQMETEMIGRIWHGWTKPENADVYEKVLKTEIFPSIASKKVQSYRGIQLT